MATRILTEEDKQDLEQMLGQPVTEAVSGALRILTEEDKRELEEKIAQAGAGPEITLESIRFTPTKSRQSAAAGAGKAYSDVTVEAIPDRFQDVSDSMVAPNTLCIGGVAYDSGGGKVYGENPYEKTATDETVGDQAELIRQIKAALTGKAAGGDGSGIPVVSDVLDFPNDAVYFETTDDAFSASVRFETDQTIAGGARVRLNISRGRFGRATKADVTDGVSFTSREGLMLLGEHVCPEAGDTEAVRIAVDAISQLHCWEMYLPGGVRETETDSQRISGYDPASINMWDTVDYADSYEIVGGAITLVDPRSMTVSHDSDNTVLLGKYIYASYTGRFHYIPDTASIKDESPTYGTSKYVTVSPAILLEYSGSDTPAGFVVSADRSALPDNEEVDGYRYLYQGTLSQTEKDAVIQALTVTENGTYTPPDGVDGYAPVTVNVPQGVQLPAIAEDVLGTASDLAKGKQLIGADGEVITGSVTRYTNDDSYTFTGTEVGQGLNNKVGIWRTTDKAEMMDAGTSYGLYAEGSNFGDAEPGDVRAGKTFTSKEGLKIPGTLEAGGGTLVAKSGTADSAVIDTGLAQIAAIMLKAATQTATGIYTASYLADHNILQYSGASVYSGVKSMFTLTAPEPGGMVSINGGVLTWKGTGSTGLISGISYDWYALGYE